MIEHRLRILLFTAPKTFGVLVAAVLTGAFVSLGLPPEVKASPWAAAGGSKRSAARSKTAASTECSQCAESRNHGKTRKKLAKPVSCHPKGYVDPKVAKNYKKAIHDLRRAGIQPKVTSTWRSTGEQARLHSCSVSHNCRKRNPGLYYALPAGHSMHEAGFAVDISGIASGARGRKRLTPQGKRIVSVMRKNGFNWRYGLKDPAHFEADPTRHGYRTVKQAIHRNQTTCDLKLAKKPGRRYRTIQAVHRTRALKR